MSTMMGVILSIVAGMVLWAVPRMAIKSMPAMALRVFWVVVVVVLVASSKVPPPYNLAMMGMGAGMAVFENLYHRHQIKAAARKAARAAKASSRKRRPEAKNPQ